MQPTSVQGRPRPRRIVFAAYEGVCLLDLSGPLEAFVASRFAPGVPTSGAYQCSVVSVRGGPVRTASGASISTESVRALAREPIDTLVVPGAYSIEEVTRDRALVDWVRQRARTCRRTTAVCFGSFLLGAAGLLGGRRATTHWLRCRELAALHPGVTVEADSIFVRDGPIWTSAGGTAGIDMALALIEDDFGHKTAMNIARILVVYLRRSGGQSQYSTLLAAQSESEDEVFGTLELWIAEHPREDLRVEALADRVSMSPRNFARVYVARRGRTPAKFVESVRVDAARRLLETTGSRVKAVAQRCGFRTEEQMRCAFIRSMGISPREYRDRFGSAPSESDRPVRRRQARVPLGLTLK